jgi:ATP-dependent DNA helicase RecQ
MGVDKADVRTVIHRDCAPSVEAYLQESGRAGRDGAQSKAILLWGPDDESSLARAKTETDKKRLTALFGYARDTTQCRRQALLEMLDYNANGESPETKCCDVCEGQASAALREEASVRDFFRRNKRCYTANAAAGVLVQAETALWSEDQAKQVINHLVKTGGLKKAHRFLWKGALASV